MHLTLKASYFHIPLFPPPPPLHFFLSLSPFLVLSLVFLHLSEEKPVLLEPWRGTICHVLQIMSLSSSASSPHAFLHSQLELWRTFWKTVQGEVEERLL